MGQALADRDNVDVRIDQLRRMGVPRRAPGCSAVGQFARTS